MLVRQLPFCVLDGPLQMAADEVMLHAATEGHASFRLYAWDKPTVSLGYFQPWRVRGAGLQELPWLRRPTGGMTLVHHHEVTYALALPARDAPQPAVFWLEQIHQLIAKMLAKLGVPTSMAGENLAPVAETPLCFHHVTRGDLTSGGAKVVGSAQRRQRGALLQHGAILLAKSPFTPTLPGLAELCGKKVSSESISQGFAETLQEILGWELKMAAWQEQEREQIEQLAGAKYRSVQWNEKR